MSISALDILLDADEKNINMPLNEYSAIIAEAHAELEELRALLKESEWAAWDFEVHKWFCWCCVRSKDRGHAPDCRLAAALKGTQNGQDDPPRD